MIAKLYLTTLLILISNLVNSSECKEEQLRCKTSAELAQLLFKDGSVRTAILSPDGNFVATVQSNGEALELILTSTKTMKRYLALQDTPNDDTEITDIEFIGNNIIAIEILSKNRGPGVLISKFTENDNSITSITNESVIYNSWIIDPLPNLDGEAVISVIKDKNPSLFKVNFYKENISGQLNNKFRLNSRAPQSEGWITNTQGIPTASYGKDEKGENRYIWYREEKTNRWKEAWKGSIKTTSIPILFLDEKTLLILTNENSENLAIYTYDIENKKYIDKVYERKDGDIVAAILNDEKKSLLGASFYKNGILTTEYFSTTEDLISSLLKNEFKDTAAYIIDNNITNNLAIIETSSPTDPGTYYLLDYKNLTLNKIAATSPWLHGLQFGATKTIKTESTDGLIIESYFTPASHRRSAGRPPLIVIPHGGPISVRDDRHFNNEVQFLSLSGFSVLQVNYRGSSGFGKDFESRGEGEWGRLIEKDIEASVDNIVNSNLADGSRVCIYGASYGGYSALISAINHPNRYRCAASYAGVTDLPLVFSDSSEKRHASYITRMMEIIGNPLTEMETMLDYSPVYQANKLTIPVFISQGLQDKIVTREHFDRFRLMLEHHKKPYEEMTFEDEAHSIMHLKNAVPFYVKLEAFFSQSLFAD